MILPSQARDTHRKTQNSAVFLQHGLIDTSQKGDMDNWRNETLNGKPWDYDEVRKRTLLRHFILQMTIFIKTGSGQTQANLI